MTEWQPQYDPDAHARRLDQGTAPQGYGQQRQPPPGQWPPQQPQYPPQYQQPQPGWQQPPPQYPPPGPGHRQPPRKRKGGLIAFLVGGSVAVIVVIAVAASANSGKTPAASASSPAAPAASAPVAASPAAAAAQTVTYSVTGSSSDVTYGPAGSDLSGHVPLHKTAKLGSPAYYAISAQLRGGGTVKCEISVNGKVISKATASGGYNIAQCEIVQDPFGNGWQDANSA